MHFNVQISCHSVSVTVNLTFLMTLKVKSDGVVRLLIYDFPLLFNGTIP